MPRGHAEAQVDDARGGRVGRRRSNQEREAKEQDSQQARGAQHGSENCGKSMQHKMNFNENLEKNDKIIHSIIKKQEELVSKFLKINPLPTHPGDRVEGAE